MSWLYHQATGVIDRDVVAFTGYSGHLQGKNNPQMQDHKELGPIPCGRYTIGPLKCIAPVPAGAVCSDCHGVGQHKHGPYVLGLTPDATNVMFDRDGFLVHGDELLHPGMASLGCIIMGLVARHAIWRSGDHELLVVAA